MGQFHMTLPFIQDFNLLQFSIVFVPFETGKWPSISNIDDL